MLLNSADNRVGLSLMVFGPPDYSKVDANELSGYMIGMNGSNDIFSRRVLIVKRREVIKVLKEETGVFEWSTLKEKLKEEKDSKTTFNHIGKFERLREVELPMADLDPLLPYTDKLSIAQSEALAERANRA